MTTTTKSYVELDCRTGDLAIDTYPETGSNAVTMDVHHGHVVRFPVTNELSGEAEARLLERAQPLAERIVSGYESVWDGSNHVASLDEDAQQAYDELAELCESEEPDVDLWAPSDWLLANCGLLDSWDSQPLDQAVRESMPNGTNGDGRAIVIDGGEDSIRDALLDAAMKWFDGKDQRLTTAHIRGLVEHERITQAQALEWALDRIDSHE